MSRIAPAPIVTGTIGNSETVSDVGADAGGVASDGGTGLVVVVGEDDVDVPPGNGHGPSIGHDCPRRIGRTGDLPQGLPMKRCPRIVFS